MEKYVFMTETELKILVQEVIRTEISCENLIRERINDPPPETDVFLSIKESAKLLGCCTNTFLRLRKEKKIPYTKVGRQIKISKQILLKLLKSNKL